eukprot:TRINITY_DN15151_c0_g1_i1.p1 TRINITY_DN15151_c0_g1~~TRINITY_DN15151_c0_g1_i1.p1  ORF type:complete len:138 (+),score=17.14 TRINITY_DN15151_c0_g1_i1:79-492(+)
MSDRKDINAQVPPQIPEKGFHPQDVFAEACRHPPPGLVTDLLSDIRAKGSGIMKDMRRRMARRHKNPFKCQECPQPDGFQPWSVLDASEAGHDDSVGKAADLASEKSDALAEKCQTTISDLNFWQSLDTTGWVVLRL